MRAAADPSIDYAHPSTPRPPSLGLFRAAVIGWAIAASVAVVCVFGCALLRSRAIAEFGLLWLLVGGGISIGASICGRIYAAKAKRASFPPPHTERRATLATLLPDSNIVLAIVCVVVGVFLFARAESSFKLRVTNRTSTKIDAAWFRLSDGSDVPIGQLAAGRTITTTAKMVGTGRLMLCVRRGDDVTEEVIDDAMDEDDVRGGLDVNITH